MKHYFLMKKILILIALFIISCGSQKTSTNQTPEQEVKCHSALEALNTLISKGDCDAEYKMGQMLFTGTCLQQDNDKAISYFYKAANKGQPKAQITLGSLFYQKPNDPTLSSCPDCQLRKDLAEALKWYQLAKKNRLSSNEEALVNRVIGEIQKVIPEKKKMEADKALAAFKYHPFRCSPRDKF